MVGVEAIPFSAVFWIKLGLFVVGHWVLLAWPTFNTRGCYDFKFTGCLKVHWAGDSWVNADDPSASIGLNPSMDISLFMHRNGGVLYLCTSGSSIDLPPPQYLTEEARRQTIRDRDRDEQRDRQAVREAQRGGERDTDRQEEGQR